MSHERKMRIDGKIRGFFAYRARFLIKGAINNDVQIIKVAVTSESRALATATERLTGKCKKMLTDWD